MSYEFHVDAMKRSLRRNRWWYQANIMKVLQDCKEKGVRDIETSVALAEQLFAILEQPVAKATPVPSHDLEPFEKDDLMKPVEPEVLNLLYGSTDKGAAEIYFKARTKKAPEDKYYFRIATNWDYGWQQKQSRQRARDVNRGRCAILRDTFYRKNNLAPDPQHYSQPAGGEISICSEYSCSFN
ncbi:protein ATP6V1FNB [Manduca sexta]|uniref:Sperm microtubule inner protein 1 C-terminal domain-containing protein n=1 Tax=Manduca sexta TaxID=7130 RepID=A0A921ZDI8_MANSE|nr:protein ATP6V1FNB [Manduca sexta]KAG6454832.1 hypothetical protein O3G_MSEX008904 [Manduca sexta]